MFEGLISALALGSHAAEILLLVLMVALISWYSSRYRSRIEGLERSNESLENLPSHEDLHGLEKRIDGVVGDLHKIATDIRKIERDEEALKRLPTHEDIRRLHKRIDVLAADSARMAGEFRGAKGTLDLIHQFLLSERK